MAKPQRTTAPAFQFYPKDFLSDEPVQRMTLTEMGAYIKLLCICWLKGSLPSDTKRLSQIVGMPEGRFARMWPNALQECFVERGGVLVNNRLEEERKKQTEFRRRNSDNAKARWDKRPQSARNATALPERQSERNALQSPISDLQSPKKNSIEDGPPLDAWFVEFAAEYPESRRTINRLSSEAFVDAFDGESDPPSHYQRLKAALANHKASEQWAERNVIPSMLKWLQERRWSQVLPVQTPTNGSRGRTGAPPKGKYDGIELRDE